MAIKLLALIAEPPLMCGLTIVVLGQVQHFLSSFAQSEKRGLFLGGQFEISPRELMRRQALEVAIRPFIAPQSTQKPHASN